MKKLAALFMGTLLATAGMNAATLEEATEAVKATENLYLIGNATPAGWDTGKAPEMTKTDGDFTWTGTLVGKDATGTDGKANPRFKFLIDGKQWEISVTANYDIEGNTTVTSGETMPLYVRPTTNTGNDNAFQVETTGEYSISVNLADMTMVCTLDKEIEYPDIFITGGATKAGWNNNTASLGNDTNRQKFTQQADGFYTWTGILNATSGDGRFRFLTSKSNNSWWLNSYTTVEETGSYEIETGEFAIRYWESASGPQPEAAFKIMATGLYTLTIDLESMMMTVARTELYILGNGAESGWDLGKWNSLPMTIEEDGTYTWQGNLMAGGTFRMAYAREWWPCITTSASSDEMLADGNHEITWSYGGRSFKVEEDGNYSLVLDFNNMSLVSTKNGEVIEKPEEALTQLWICGSALCGKEGGWSNNDEYIKPMEATENPGEFVYTGDLYATGGEFKFRLEGPSSGSWDGFVADYSANTPVESGNVYGIASTSVNHNDRKFLITEDGKYKITANTYGENKTLTVEKLGTDALESIASEEFTVSVSGRQVTVTGEATVYDAMGRVAGTVANGTLTLPAAGIYVVAANGNATKIAVK